MSALTFTLKKTLQHSLNCAALTPNNLANKSANEIAGTLLQYGKSRLRTDEVFDVTGDDTQNIHFKNSTNKLDYLGANMSAGALTIQGDAGAYLGYGLSKGEIHCHGNTEAFTACNMAGGLLRIDGNAGDFLGGASAGLRKGMRGGTVIVKGNAADRVGDQMRRGLILIEGNTGDYCGSRMIAGTIGVLGKIGQYAGFNMQRGTLLFKNTPKLHASIQDCGVHTLPFLSLMFKSFEKYDTKFSRINTRRVQRYVGDVACNGNGEILLLNI
ncbi:MAG TPA: formylmethanofuran dehydrogenase subunit C [Methylotenera sp.]|nr:formylmethanofuran dehydrogenase subunit C [Methylotenera sp.]